MPYCLISSLILLTLAIALPVAFSFSLDKYENLFHDEKGRHIYYERTLIEMEDEGRVLDTCEPRSWLSSLKQLYHFMM